MPFKKNNKATYTLKVALTTSSLLLISFLSQANTEDGIAQLNNEESFQICLDDIRNTTDFSKIKNETFNSYRPTQADFSVLDSLNYQPEFKKAPWDYHSALVDIERVSTGIELKHQLSPILSKIEDKYGVKQSDVLAVWGVESNYGQSLGKKNILTSLATLSCYGRRQAFFRKEYASALLIIQNGDVNAVDMNGSWAGAFGQTQFMPSTYLSLAQDFDGDGRKDLVNSKADALASTANFLKKAGYRTREPWGYEVKIPLHFDAKSNRRDKKDLAYWRENGFVLTNGSPIPDAIDSLALIMPSGPEGPAFLTGKNFDTFYSYNASESYALAIAHLSELIKTKSLNTHFDTPWPTDDPGISRQQSKDIQTALIFLGYDIGEADGLIGSKTREAIKSFQAKNNLETDGRAGRQLYNYFEAQGLLKKTASETEDTTSSTSNSSEDVRSAKSQSPFNRYVILGIGLSITLLLLLLFIKRKK